MHEAPRVSKKELRPQRCDLEAMAVRRSVLVKSARGE
jgi:hypothetical protein